MRISIIVVESALKKVTLGRVCVCVCQDKEGE